MTKNQGGTGFALSEDQVRERVATLKRFKELLERQKRKFSTYLTVLDHQKDDIESGDVDKLVAHVELEQQVVSEIFAFQKVIDPMEAMYETVRPGDSLEVHALKTAVEEMRVEVIRRNKENRVLLKDKMDLIRNEIKTVRANPAMQKRSIYAGQGEATIVDISS